MNCQIKATLLQYIKKTFKFWQQKVTGLCFQKFERNIFYVQKSSQNLCKNDTFERFQVNSVYHGTESLSFLGPKI